MMKYVEIQDVKNRYTGDPFTLPADEILTTIIEDAEDILSVKIPNIDDLVSSSEISPARVKRIVSNAIIRFLNTASEGIVSNSLSYGGNYEQVMYDSKHNKSSVFYTEEELNQLKPSSKGNRLSLFNMYGDGSSNTVQFLKGHTAYYSTDEHILNKNDYYS